MSMSSARKQSRNPKRSQIDPRIAFALTGFGVGVIASLGFLVAGVAKEFTILGGTVVAIVVSLMQMRNAIYSSERTQLGALEERSAAIEDRIKALKTVSAEVFRHERDTLNNATQLQERARTRISAMWTVMPYTSVLRQYLEESTNNFLGDSNSRVIQRVVDLENRPEDITDHLCRTWEQVRSGQYEVAFASHIEIEMLIVDARDAALYLQPGRGYDCVHLEGTDPGFVDVINTSFQQVWVNAIALSTDLITAEPDRNRIRAWLAEEAQRTERT